MTVTIYFISNKSSACIEFHVTQADDNIELKRELPFYYRKFVTTVIPADDVMALINRKKKLLVRVNCDKIFWHDDLLISCDGPSLEQVVDGPTNTITLMAVEPNVDPYKDIVFPYVDHPGHKETQRRQEELKKILRLEKIDNE